MEERKPTPSSTEPDDKTPSMQQRVQEGSASFDFDALLRGVSTKAASEQKTDSRPSQAADRPRSTTSPLSARAPLLVGVSLALIAALWGAHWLVTSRNESAQKGAGGNSSHAGRNAPNSAMQSQIASLPPNQEILSSETADRPGKMRIQLAHNLTGPFTYWFVAASQQASSPHPLAQPDAHGIVILTIPAAYNQPDAQLRIHDLSQGKIARMDVVDFTHPDMFTKQQVGPNLLKNAGFEDGMTGWAMEQDGTTAHGTLQLQDGLDGPVGVTGRIAHLQITAIDDQNWHLQCIQGGLTVKEGKKYQVAFWAKSDHDRNIPVNAQLDMPDWHTIGLASSLALTPRWQKYSLVFTPRNSVSGHTRLAFLAGDAVGTIEITGISLRRLMGDNISKQRDPQSASELDLAAFH